MNTMPATSRGGKAAASLIRAYQNPRICSDCISSLTPRRAYAAAAAQAAAPAETATPPPSSDAATAVVPYKIQSGILLSRPPIITRELSSFEKAFYFYQRRLNERLAMPFTRYFYFKKDTPADNAWKAKAKLRNGAPARDLGGYNPYGELGWNDELLVGDQTSEPEVMRQRLIEDAVNKTEEEKDAGQEETEEAVKPLPRRTEADIKKDTKRLDRKLERTLYLVVKNKDGKWVLPAGEVIGRENLHQAAERVLVQSAGSNMNTWIVGHVPIGHYVSKPRLAADQSPVKAGEKTFFMKGRIMAGQANLNDNAFGWQDFKWLTKNEVEGHVGPAYFSRIKDMMAER